MFSLATASASPPGSSPKGEIPVSSYVPLQRCQWTPPPLGGGRVGVQAILMHILLPRPSGTRCRQACFPSSLGIAKASFSSALAHSSNLHKMGNWGRACIAMPWRETKLGLGSRYGRAEMFGDVTAVQECPNYWIRET